MATPAARGKNHSSTCGPEQGISAGSEPTSVTRKPPVSRGSSDIQLQRLAAVAEHLDDSRR